MKTLIILLSIVVSSFAGFTQTTDSGSNERNMAFSTDEIIHSKPSENQRNIRSSSAFNGWMYAVYTINDTANSKGGIYVGISKDDGLTWKKFITYQFGKSYYPLVDILVTGTDTSSLYVFVAGVLENTQTSKYSIYMDKFDGRNGALLAGQVYQNTFIGTKVTDIALASDYLSPSNKSAPYSLSLLYATHNNLKDSLMLVSSLNAGLSFSAAKTIYSTSHVLHKVSLAYGKSASNPDGTYFAAWEVIQSANSTLGHIYTSHEIPGSASLWQTPFCLDSGSVSLYNKLRNPSIACQYNHAKNDSNGLSVVIAYERESGGHMSVTGSYNKKACTTQNWTSFSITSSNENDLTPNVLFDPSTNNFLLTYMDSTNGRLPYAFQGFNISSPNSWTFSSIQYNDQTSQLKMATPRIVFNLKMGLPGFVWINEAGGNQNGVAMFDAAYANLITGIGSNHVRTHQSGFPWPNPASSILEIPFMGSGEELTVIIMYDLLGKEVYKESKNANTDTKLFDIDIAGLSNGSYFIHVIAKEERVFRIVIHH